MLARLTSAGLAGRLLEPGDQARASSAVMVVAMGGFLACGVAMWSELTIGWQWARPATGATVVAMVLMSVAVVLLALLGAAALVRVGASVVRACLQGEAPVRRPALLAATAAAVLVWGGINFGRGWPGTFGHHWAHQGLVPGGVGAFSWATTLSVSAYWAHPGALARFPAPELAWMAVSPLAILCLVVGAARTLWRLRLPAPALRFCTRLDTAALAGMVLFFAGASCWVIDGGPGPHHLFDTGAIDVGSLAVMATALAASCQAVLRTHATRARAVAS